MRRCLISVAAVASASLLALMSACGGTEATKPDTPPVPPPVITSLHVTPADGVEPGGVMMVHYTVTSTQPLSRLRFFRTGALTTSDSIGGRGSLSVTDSIALPVPGTTPVGVPISLRMEAEDVAHGVASLAMTASLSVLDRTPPVMWAVVRGWIGTFNTSIDTLRYAADDTVILKVSAKDNAGLRWVGYRLTGAAQARDSLAIVGTPADTIVLAIALQAGWVGTSGITAFARDASGNEVTATGRLTIYPVVQRPTAVLPLAKQLTRFIYDAKRATVVASHWDDVAAVELITLAPLAHAATIPLPGLAQGMDFTASGDSLLVALGATGSLAVVDLTARRVVGTIPITLPGLQGKPIRGVAVSASGKAFVSVFTAGPATYYAVAEVDLATGAQRVRTDAYGGALMALGANRDRTEILMSGAASCLQLYVAASDQITTCKPGASAGGVISSDASGMTFLMGPAFVDRTFSSLRILTVPRFNSPVSQLSSDGATAYFATGAYSGGVGSGFTTVRTSDGMVLERTPLPISPEVSLLLPDGSAILTHGRMCRPLGGNSSACEGLKDIYVTDLR